MRFNNILKYSAILIFLIALIYFIKFRKNDSEGLFPKIPENFSNWFNRELIKIYKGREIFDFIDGEGEIYLEYDFKAVAVQQYFNNDKNIELAVYNMGNSSDAFGIFSLYQSDEGEKTGIGNDDRTTDYSIKFWKDKYFVNIISYNRSIREEIVSLAKIISGNILNKGEKPEILKYFADFDKNRIIYFHGKSSLNSIYYVADKNVMRLNQNTEGIVCDCAEEGRKILLIKYKNGNSAQNSMESLNKYVRDESVKFKDNCFVWKRAENSFDTFTIRGNYLVGVLEGGKDSFNYLIELIDKLNI